MKRKLYIQKNARLWCMIFCTMLLLTGSNLFAQTRIMPLGNSITYDNNTYHNTHPKTPEPHIDRKSYRRPLDSLLTEGGYSFDFVGSQRAGDPDVFDIDNEGYPGMSIDFIAGKVYDLLTANPADYVLLHIGTNDSGIGTPASRAEKVGELLDEIDRYETDNSTEVTVLLALIINKAAPTASADITDFNSAVVTMAQERVANDGDEIVLVDMENGAGLDYRVDGIVPYDDGDFHDELHPNDDGYVKMAHVWYDALTNILTPSDCVDCEDCPEGIAHYWHLDQGLVEGDGAFYADSIGSLVATPTGEPLAVEAKIGRTSARFNGSNYLSVSNAGGEFNWTKDESFTIELWMKDEGTTNLGVFAGKIDNTVAKGMQIWVGMNPDGTAAFQLLEKDGVNNKQINSTGVFVDDGNWHHIVAVRDASVNQNRLYVDGVLRGSVSTVGLYEGDFDAPVDFLIGTSTIGGTSFTGSIDEVAVYNSAVGMMNITAHYNGGTGRRFCDEGVSNNNPPEVSSEKEVYVNEGEELNYLLTATDEDGDVVSFQNNYRPSWIGEDGWDGERLRKMTTSAQIGEHEASFKVSDTKTFVFFNLAIYVNAKPEIKSVPSTVTVKNTEYSYKLEALDKYLNEHTWSVKEGPAWLSVDVTATDTTLVGTPPAVGDYDVVLEVTDGYATTKQTFTLSVVTDNKKPVFSSTPVTNATQGDDYEYTVAATDADGDDLTFSIESVLPGWLSFDPATKKLTGTPGSGDVKDVSVTIKADDGEGESNSEAFQVFTIVVANINDAPEFDLAVSPITDDAEQGTEFTYTVKATDADEDALVYSPENLPTWLTFVSPNKVVGTPGNEHVGDTVFTVKADDQQGEGNSITSQVVTVTVSNINDAPVFTSATTDAATEDIEFTYTIAATDDDGDDLTFSAENLPGWLSFEAPNLVKGTPLNENVGDTVFTVKADDGNGSIITQNVEVSVTNVNDAPEFTSTPSTEVNEGDAYAYTLEVEDIDAGDEITLSAPTLPTWLSFNEFTGELKSIANPDDAEVGSHDVLLKATDGDVEIEQSFSIVVVNANDAPAFTSVPVTAATEEQPYSYTATAEDDDADAVLSFTGITIPDWMSFDAATGKLTGDPDDKEVKEGPYNVVLSVSDGIADAVDQEFTVTVTNVNDKPVITSAAITTASKDVLYEYTFTATDADGDDLTLSASIPVWLSFDASTGLLSGTPGLAQTGEYVVTLEATDGTATATQTFKLNVIDANNPPTSIALSGMTVEEGSATGTFIGKLSTEDEDADDEHTYTLPELFANNSEFEISNDSLFTKSGNFDYETKDQYLIRVVVSDGNDGTFQKDFTINVVNLNEEPTNILLSSFTVEENAVEGTEVGTLSTVDENGEDSHTYSLLDGVDDNASFELSGNKLLTKAVFNFETKTSYKVTVKSDDGNGGTIEKQFIVKIKDANDAPTSLNLSNNVVAEDAAIGAVVGNLSTTDEDATDSHTYSLTGTSDDNNLFEIDGNQLKTKVVLNYEDSPKYTINVKVEDAAGASFSKQITILVGDISDTYALGGKLAKVGGEAVNESEVILYKKLGKGEYEEISKQTLVETDTFTFEQLPLGEYTVKVTATATDLLPTYYGDVLLLTDASVEALTNADESFGVITVMAKPAPTAGYSTIDGEIGKPSGRDPLSGVNIYLYDKTTGELVAFVTSGTDGSFTFENLEIGTYIVKPDYEGTPVEETTSEVKIKFNREEIYALVSVTSSQIIMTTDQVTGIEDELKLSNISVYPNPVQDQLTISLENNVSGTYELRLFNQSGQLIQLDQFTKSDFANEHSISLGTLPTGLYILHVIKDQQMAVKKVVKQ
ncbi:putative Ig domain-containing protein [Flammeovirgaceae bacterium SG7u.111]|nr:putative Ig domain-containing protein [Flammeovirgaceae bacterium SG7u.132]WPO35962.1 putative Ig domain-containing protein [Flammeovirgaceae bacterium SG7u.111]